MRLHINCCIVSLSHRLREAFLKALVETRNDWGSCDRLDCNNKITLCIFMQVFIDATLSFFLSKYAFTVSALVDCGGEHKKIVDDPSGLFNGLKLFDVIEKILFACLWPFTLGSHNARTFRLCISKA